MVINASRVTLCISKFKIIFQKSSFPFLKDEVSDQPAESQPLSGPCNFTSPLPSLAGPDQEPAVRDEQEGLEEDALPQLQPSLSEGEEAYKQEGEAVRDEIKEGAELKNEEDVLEEIQSERVEKNQEEGLIVEEGDKEGVVDSLTSELDLDSSTKKNSDRSESPTEDHTPPSKPELLNSSQRSPPDTKASHLTKHDKRIIEKIRSYYEAAAKAEEDEAAEDSELEERGESRRRNSFSHIPSGLVKESVSRFHEFGHLGEPESEQIRSEFNEASDIKEDLTCCTDCPVANPSELLVDAENNEEADKAKCSASQSSDAESQLSAASKGSEIPGLVAPIQNSPTKEEDEGMESQREVLGESAEEVLEVSQERKKGFAAPGLGDGPPIAKEHICSEETRATGTQTIGRECKKSSSTEPKGNTKELPKEPVAHAEHCRKPGTKDQSSWVRKKPRDLAKVSRNLDGQSKVGQWSYHSRIVTSNRALFEAMGSDVASIGLFEATPEVDPVLIENSERILSKVHTLAQMFGSKAGSMKVPLHQKLGTTTQSPPWDMAGLPGHSLHTHSKSKTHVQSQSDNDNAAKIQNQNDVCSQSQEKTQEEGRVQEEKTLMKSNSKFLKSFNFFVRLSPDFLKFFMCHKIFANLK